MTEKSREPKGGASVIWGGRFDAGPSAIMDAINVSIDFDRRLLPQDIAASKAHCRMLARQGVIVLRQNQPFGPIYLKPAGGKGDHP